MSCIQLTKVYEPKHPVILKISSPVIKNVAFPCTILTYVLTHDAFVHVPCCPGYSHPDVHCLCAVGKGARARGARTDVG